MALTSNIDVLLKEYNTNEVLENEIKKLNWLLPKLKKDNQWSLGEYTLPAETQQNSRFEWGALPAQSDIPKAAYAKPVISAPKQLLGSLHFDQQDLSRHNGDLKKSFLSIMPGKLKQFTERMNEQINLSVLGDGSLCSVTANSTAGGVVTVGKAKIGYFTGGQKVSLLGTGLATLVSGYVRSINVNAGTFLLYNAATGGAVVDLTNYTTAAVTKVYQVGATTERVTSLMDIIFSAATGGADTLYGGSLVKADSAVFQPYYNDIAASNTAATFISSLYDSYFEMVEMGRSGVNKEVVMPFHAFKAVAKHLEGSRQYAMEQMSGAYGSKALKLIGPDGDMVLRAARGIPTTKVFLMDYDAVTLISRGELIKKANPMSDKEAFEIRATTGYSYVVDKMAEFELAATNLQALGGLTIASAIT